MKGSLDLSGGEWEIVENPEIKNPKTDEAKEWTAKIIDITPGDLRELLKNIDSYNYGRKKGAHGKDRLVAAKRKFKEFFEVLIQKAENFSKEDISAQFKEFLQDPVKWKDVGPIQNLVKEDCKKIVEDGLGLNKKQGIVIPI